MTAAASQVIRVDGKEGPRWLVELADGTWIRVRQANGQFFTFDDVPAEWLKRLAEGKGDEHDPEF